MATTHSHARPRLATTLGHHTWPPRMAITPGLHTPALAGGLRDYWNVLLDQAKVRDEGLFAVKDKFRKVT